MQYTITLDFNQSRSEAIDMDMEVEARLNGSYQEVGWQLPVGAANVLCQELSDIVTLPFPRPPLNQLFTGSL